MRTYQQVARLMVVLLVVASVLPAVAHTCMMADAHDGAMMMQCCCERAAAMHHGVMPEEDEHCEDEEEMAHGEMDHGEMDHSGMHGEHAGNMQGDCCEKASALNELDAVASYKAAPPIPDEAPLLFVATEKEIPRVVQQAPAFLDLGPQPDYAPPFHILYAQFLT